MLSDQSLRPRRAQVLRAGGPGPERPSERDTRPERPPERATGPERPPERDTGPERRAAGSGTAFEFQPLNGASGDRADAGIPGDPVSDAYGAGYREGYATAETAFREAAATDTRQISSLVTALGAATRDLAEREAVALVHMEDVIAAAALELAEAVVGREVAASTDPGRDALARALALTPGAAEVTVHLNPDDLARLGDVSELLNGVDASFVGDHLLGSGDCLVDVGRRRLDARIASALDRVREVLLG